MSKQARLYGRRGPFARDMVARHEEFHAGAMRGERDAYVSTGRLPSEYVSQLRAMPVEPLPYVVYSYGTPIAWIDHDGNVTIPDVSYSVTTSRHQGIVRSWLMGHAYPAAYDRIYQEG